MVLGDTEYEGQYPKPTFEAKRKDINESIQNAKRKLRAVRRAKKSGVANTLSSEKVNDLLSEKMFLIHQSYKFEKKIDALESFVELPGNEYTPSDMDDLKHDISLWENHLADLQRPKFKIENTLDDSESHTNEISKFEELVKSYILTLRKKYSDSRTFHEEQSRNSFEEENLRIKNANEASQAFFFFFNFFFSIFFFSFFFRQLLRLVASRHLEKMVTRNVEIGIGSVNETCGPSVLGSCIL